MSETLSARPLEALDLDVEARPEAPDLGPVSRDQRRSGQHLAAIHRHYLSDLARIAQVLRRIEAGDAPPSELAHIVLHAEMAQNFRAFGNLCGQECRVLQMHHDIEEQAIFPALHARGSDGFRAVVDKLRAEHEVVHELLRRLGAAADRLMQDPGPDAMAEASAIFDRLAGTVRSHFRYEETALAEALGVYGVQV